MATINNQLECETGSLLPCPVLVIHGECVENAENGVIELELDATDTYALISELLDWLGTKAGA